MKALLFLSCTLYFQAIKIVINNIPSSNKLYYCISNNSHKNKYPCIDLEYIKNTNNNKNYNCVIENKFYNL